jgi:hypothetical protein
MPRVTVMLAAAMVLAACGDGPALQDPAADAQSAASTDGAPAAADDAPAPAAAAPPEAAPPQPAPPQPVPPPAVPSSIPPAAPAPAPRSESACAAVTASGPAREVALDGVRRALRGIDYRRGSFETNDGYRARILPKLEAVEALAVAQTGAPHLVFSLPIPAYRLAYDPVAHELAIGSDLGLLRAGSAIGMGDFVLVSSTERQVGSHLGTIAYGARTAPGVQREVSRIAGDQLGVIVPGTLAGGWPASFARLYVRMTPAEAAAAKDALAVLFVARLEPPFFVTGEFVQEAKPSEPVEKRLAVEAIKVAIDCAAVYDRRSGRLLRQIMPAAPPAAG